MALASSAYNTFQSDPGRQEIWLLILEAYNTVTEADATLYFSSAQYGTGPLDTPSSQAFKACITRGFEFAAGTEKVDGPLYGLLPARSGGSLVLGQVLGDLDLGNAFVLGGVPLYGTPLRDYAFAGRRATVKHGGYSPALGRLLEYDEFKDVFVGEVDGQPKIGGSTVVIKLRTKDSRFEYPINTRTFYGCKGAIIPITPTTTDGYVTAGTNTAFDITSGAFSWEALLYFDALPSVLESIICKGLLATDGYTIERTTAGKIKVGTHQAGASQFTESSVFPLQYWTRLTVRRSGANIDILANGVDITETHGTHTNPVSAAARNLRFFSNSSATGFALMLISDIRFWSASIGNFLISANMHRPFDPSEYATANLVGYWPCDDGTGTVLDQKVAATLFSDGTLIDGAEFTPSLMGGTEMQGDMLPEVFGYFDGFDPVLVHEGRQIYQVHSSTIHAIDRVDIGGTTATALSVDYTSVGLIEFLANPTPSGKHDICMTLGGTYVRFGGNPAHPVTIAGRGDNTGATFRYTISTLVRFIVCNRGWYPLADPTDLDTSSFLTLETANSSKVGITFKDERSVADVVNFLLQTAGAVGYFTRNTDLFKVKQFVAISDAGTPTITITENDIDQSEIEVLDINTPVFRVQLRYKHNPKVLTPSDFTAGLAGTDREKFVIAEWRRVSQVDRDTKETYPDSTVLIYDTAYYEWIAALTEAARQRDLLKTPSQGFRFKIKQGKIDLDRMDVIYFDYADKNEAGFRQLRLGAGPTRKMHVLDVADDADSSGAVITIWRDDA